MLSSLPTLKGHKRSRSVRFGNAYFHLSAGICLGTNIIYGFLFKHLSKSFTCYVIKNYKLSTANNSYLNVYVFKNCKRKLFLISLPPLI